jgi:NADH-quinone oxidoreductase chain G
MVTLTIDDKQVSVGKDATIYDAAKAAGIKIPIICHDKKLHPFGGCRMCLVEVEQMKGRLIPACTTPVTEGMIVRTTNDEIVKARTLVLELLLLKHPLDCPVCDAAGDCELQNLTFEYQVNKNNFSDEKFHEEIDYNNPLIERDMNRCVHCGKCARICDEIVSFGALTFVNRGIEAQIGTPFGDKLDCEFCGSCVSVCPVGALLSRPFKFKSRWWALNKVESVCSYCGTGCQLTYGVKDGKVLTTVYDEDQGFHNGQLCCRGRFGYQYINSEKRLKTPLIRKNGNLVEATWEEAYAVVAEKLQAAKGATGTLVTPRLTNEEFVALKQLVADGLGSDNLDHSAGYAHQALTAGLFQSFGATASPSTISDIQKSDLLLVVKTDAYETHPVIGFEINLGVKRQDVQLRIIGDKQGKVGKLPGAKTYVHKPGAEMQLVNALAAAVVAEGLASAEAQALPGYAALKDQLVAYAPDKVAAQCGLTADEIVALAKEYAAAEKALILLPLGLAYPGHDAKLATALANLAILAGKIGKEGSGLLVMGEKNNSQGAADLGLYPQKGGKNAQQMLTAVAAGELKALYVIGENPVISYPDRKAVEAALDKVDFLVVQDLFLTETAAKAHVVLPACSAAEKEGSFTSVGRVVQRVSKAIPAVGKSLADLAIFTELGKRLGVQIGGNAELAAKISVINPAYAGIAFTSLGTNGVITTPKITPALLPVDATAPAAEAGKYALLTGNALHHCGTMSLHGEGPLAVSPAGYLELSRTDAAALKVEDGDQVTVTSAKGAVKLAAKVTPRLAAGTVFAPYHFAENSINTLTSGAQVTWVSIAK